MWACPLCVSKKKQVRCCGTTALARDNGKVQVYNLHRVCEYSLFRASSIEAFWKHMCDKHGYKEETCTV